MKTFTTLNQVFADDIQGLLKPDNQSRISYIIEVIVLKIKLLLGIIK